MDQSAEIKSSKNPNRLLLKKKSKKKKTKQTT